MLPNRLKQSPPIKKPKLLRSNPLRFTLIRLKGSDPRDVLIDDEDICVLDRRIELVKNVKIYRPNEDLPPDITKRLALARSKAMARYHELHGVERT